MKNQFSMCVRIISIILCACAFSLSVKAATWTGGGSDNNWSTAENWGGTAPLAGDPLVFTGTLRATNVNDTVADTSYSGITFNSGAALFWLNGNRITLGGDVTNNDGDTHRINFDMILDATRIFTLSSGSLFANGVLSGTGGITTKGSNSRTLVLTGENTFQGLATTDGSNLRISNAKALGTTDNGVEVKDGYRLELDGGIIVSNEAAYITGRGGNYNGAIQATGGNCIWAGPITLGVSGTRLGTRNGSATSLTVSGVIDDGPNSYSLAVRVADGSGPVILTNTNRYDGETQVVVGTVILDGGDNRLPVQTVVRLGNSSNISEGILDLNGWNQQIKGLTRDGSSMYCDVINSSGTYSTLTVSNNSPYTYTGYISDHINLVKKGSSTLTLDTKVNDFDGETVVSEGTLALGDPLSVGYSTFNTSDSFGTLSFTDNTVINFGGLIGTNNLVLTNTLGQSVSLRIRGEQSTVFEGQLSDGQDFTKTGGGTFTMLKPNSFSGKAYLLGGTLYLPNEDSLGSYPASFVQDQITFAGGTLKANTNYLFAANNRGVTIASNEATFYMGSYTGILTVAKQLVGEGGVNINGAGVVQLTASNSYDGVTTVINKALRITDNFALGSTIGETIVENGGQLELTDGVVVTGEAAYISGYGITGEDTKPPSSGSTNRGALQAGPDATAEWAGPVYLVSELPRVGAQNGGHLIISGVISDAGSPVYIRTSSNGSDKNRGVVFAAQNTYGGRTELTRGTLFMGVTNALPSGSIVNVHFAESNNGEYAGLDLYGFDQVVAGLMNTGNTGANAAIVNSSARPAVLTVNQNFASTYNGTIKDDVSLVKEGSGSLIFGYPTSHTGSTTVSGGTLGLGANNVLSSNSPVIMDGGTLDAGSYTNNLDSLTVTADSTINLGSGELAFTDQGSSAWSGQLYLIGTLGPTSLYFDPQLTSDQLSLISYDGKPVYQNADGYIRELQGTLLMIN